MIISVDEWTKVQDLQGGTVLVTRPTIMGKVASHIIKSPYNSEDIAAWLFAKLLGKALLVQERFPLMNAEDREFLISGITPAAWAQMFPVEEDDENRELH